MPGDGQRQARCYPASCKKGAHFGAHFGLPLAFRDSHRPPLILILRRSVSARPLNPAAQRSLDQHTDTPLSRESHKFFVINEDGVFGRDGG